MSLNSIFSWNEMKMNTLYTILFYFIDGLRLVTNATNVICFVHYFLWWSGPIIGITLLYLSKSISWTFFLLFNTHMYMNRWAMMLSNRLSCLCAFKMCSDPTQWCSCDQIINRNGILTVRTHWIRIPQHRRDWIVYIIVTETVSLYLLCVHVHLRTIIGCVCVGLWPSQSQRFSMNFHSVIVKTRFKLIITWIEFTLLIKFYSL